MTEPIEDIVLFQIERTSKISKIYSQREFDRLGLSITVEQWILLKIVQEHNGISQKELAEKSLRDPASITRTLDILQKKEWVQRKPIPDNRRQYAIELTKSGQSFITENIDIVQAHRQKSTEGFSASEIKLLSSFLSRIQDNLK